MVHHILDAPIREWSSNILWKNFTNIDQLVTKVGSNEAIECTFEHWMHLRTWDRSQLLSRPWLVVEYDKCAVIKKLRQLRGKICKTKSWVLNPRSLVFMSTPGH